MQLSMNNESMRNQRKGRIPGSRVVREVMMDLGGQGGFEL